MADMKFVLKRDAGIVRRWDYETRTWMVWTGGDFSPPNMVGTYRLVIKAKKWTLQRISRRGLQQWEEFVPEGVSSFHVTKGGGKVVLPWEETDPFMKACRLVGISKEEVVFEPTGVMEVTLGLGDGTTPEGRKYRQWYSTDGIQTTTLLGVRVQLPGFIVTMDVIEPVVAGKPEQRIATMVYVWKDKYTGGSVSPKSLMKAILNLKLRNQMDSWEQDLYRDYLQSKKEGGA